MPEEDNKSMAQEHVERRRLSRLLEALPVFSGYISPDGHLSRTQPATDASFLWSLPAFSYAHDSVTQIVDLCESAARGERVQIERTYWKKGSDETGHYREGLLTLTPILDENDYVDEIAVSLIDNTDVVDAPINNFAKSRLTNANRRISGMLDLAQTVIEASQSTLQDDRNGMARRLDTLASVIDLISDPDLSYVSLHTLIENSVQFLPDSADCGPLQLDLNESDIPVLTAPLITLLLSELLDNAAHHGAWRRRPGDPVGTVSIQAEILTDSAQNETLHLNWMEDHGPVVPAVLGRGFGIMLGERLFPQLTGGHSHMLNSEDGISWTFKIPISAEDAAPNGKGLP